MQSSEFDDVTAAACQNPSYNTYIFNLKAIDVAIWVRYSQFI
jgi:hypothetical protein